MSKSCLMILLFISNSLFAQIYKWVDSNQSAHYSDQPYHGAQIIGLPQLQLYSATGLSTHHKRSNKNISSAYNLLAITQPRDGETIRTNDGNLAVLLQLQPDRAVGHKIELIFDGKVVGSPQKQLVFKLRSLARGTHTLSAQLIDNNKRVLIKSKTLVIYMHRPYRKK